MIEKTLMDIIHLWCINFSVEYIEERNYWQGVIVHRSAMPSNDLYQQETGTWAEHNDVLVQAVALLKTRASAACCVIETRKESRRE